MENPVEKNEMANRIVASGILRGVTELRNNDQPLLGYVDLYDVDCKKK